MNDYPRSTAPASRNGFEIAILCALPLEHEAVFLLVDQFWDDEGKVPAASAATNIRRSYPSICLTLIVGICGGVPVTGNQEVILGDVIISNVLIHRDFGRQLSDRFEIRNSIEDVPGRPNRDIRSLLRSLEGGGRFEVEEQAAHYLQQLQQKNDAGPRLARGRYNYPGAENDRLFEDSYEHKH
ncbi:hypothetical protein N0V85_009213 [Neurospora sp. IMI 360204]|nr:hypothetical protein N0V85_009213 [Neurospora sp. IMI 360204]